MKKNYTSPTLALTCITDVIATSNQVETGRVPFPKSAAQGSTDFNSYVNEGSFELD